MVTPAGFWSCDRCAAFRQSGLSAASLTLEHHEVDALATAYSDVRALDSSGEPLVNWRGFVGDVDLVFTTPGLEKNPSADVEVCYRFFLF